MDFRTIVDIPTLGFQIEPCDEILFVGSCFADSIGQRFREEGFPVTVNPYGTMYNPASVLHTAERYEGTPRVVFITLGTNHVYRLKETGEIVDNCQKRPQSLFQEEELTIEQCCSYLEQTISLFRQRNPSVHVVLTVSPIRYRKYGYHESLLSKATLLLAVDKLASRGSNPSLPSHPSRPSRPSQPSQTSEPSKPSITTYFPSYEILMDELRDYRFYAPDMLHPSQQAVEYIWERLVDACFSPAAKDYLNEWRPLKQALSHRPFDPDAEAYHIFLQQTQRRLQAFQQKYPAFKMPDV